MGMVMLLVGECGLVEVYNKGEKRLIRVSVENRGRFLQKLKDCLEFNSYYFKIFF